jgi:hypothetical protein
VLGLAISGPLPELGHFISFAYLAIQDVHPVTASSFVSLIPAIGRNTSSSVKSYFVQLHAFGSDVSFTMRTCSVV